MNSIELNKLIKLLETTKSCGVGVVTAESLVKEIQWETLPKIKPVFANLHHFWHDEDIRNKDEYYKSMQESELDKLIFHLMNQDWVMANGVSFLEISGT